LSRLRVGVGEFALILVSVFLALAAERWVAGRADRDLVSQYTEDLRTDLARDSGTIEVWARSGQRRAAALEQMLGALNGTAPGLLGAEAVSTMHVAQIVPIPNFRSATYQDLVSSGNIRLLPASVRRALVQYHDALAELDRRLALTGYQQKPEFADLLPAVVRRQFLTECFPRVAAEVFPFMSEPEKAVLEGWTQVPGIRMELERTLNGTIGFLDALERVSQTRDETADALRGRDSA
jgi:hypothetical protein